LNAPFTVGSTYGRFALSFCAMIHAQRRGCMITAVGGRKRVVWIAWTAPASFEYSPPVPAREGVADV